MKEVGETYDARRLLHQTVQHHGRPHWIWERHALNVDAASRWAVRHQVPRLVELNAPLALERDRYSRLRWSARATRIERDTLRSADRIVTVSSWLAEWALAQGCHPDRVRHVPNGTALQTSPNREATRARLGLKGQVVGFVGGLRPWHGTAFLGSLLDALPEATLLIVGQGPCPPPPHPRIQHLPWAPPDQLADLISAMDVALAPYEKDTAPWFGPLKISDYQSQGVPIIASPYGDIPSILGPRGVFVPELDPRAWARAILDLQGTRLAPEVRSWDQVVEACLDGFKGAMS
jgi:glycosyltransferase involved in cell wall biosynthesis